MASFPSKVGRGFAGIAFVGRVSTVGDEQFGQDAVVCCGGGKQRRKASGLSCVGRRAVVEQQQDYFTIFAKGDGSMERLVLLRIAAYRFDVCADRQQGCDGCGSSKASGEMKGCPSVGRIFVDRRRRRAEDRLEAGIVAEGCSLEKVNRIQVGEQKIAQQRLSAIDRPEERGHSLRIAGGGESGIGIDNLAKPGRVSALDQFEGVDGCPDSLFLSAISRAV